MGISKGDILFFNSYRVSRGGLGAYFDILTKEDVLNGKECDRYGFVGGSANNICYMTIDEFCEIFSEDERVKAIEILKTLPSKVVEEIVPKTTVNNKDVKVGDVILDYNKKPSQYVYLGKCNVNGVVGFWYYQLGYNKTEFLDTPKFNNNYSFKHKKTRIKISKIIGHVDLDLINGLEWESVHYSTKEITKYKLKFLAN